MKTSAKGQKFIQCWETLALERYWDKNDGWTIGWGHLIKKGEKMLMKVTKEEADEILRKDLKYFESFLDVAVKVKLTQQQFDALVSLVFNIGVGQFIGSTLLKRLNEGDYEGAADQFKWWRKDDGKVVNGLVTRRAQETDIFKNGVYTYTHTKGGSNE